jgi:hypothetical protein
MPSALAMLAARLAAGPSEGIPTVLRGPPIPISKSELKDDGRRRGSQGRVFATGSDGTCSELLCASRSIRKRHTVLVDCDQPAQVSGTSADREYREVDWGLNRLFASLLVTIVM